MVITVFESGRPHRWRPVHPVHPTLSLVTHAAAALVVLAGASAPRDAAHAARASRAERLAYVAPRYRVVAPTVTATPNRHSPETARARALPASAVRLLAPRAIPDRLPAVPAVDIVALAVPVVTDVMPDALDPVRGGPSAGELLSEATDAMLAATLKGYPAAVGGLEYLMDRGLVPFDNNPRPAYPEPLLAAHVEGSVRVSFMVDLAGRPDLRSVRVLHSTNELFTRAVRAALPRLRFRRLRREEAKVAILVEQPFVFALR